MPGGQRGSWYWGLAVFLAVAAIALVLPGLQDRDEEPLELIDDGSEESPQPPPATSGFHARAPAAPSFTGRAPASLAALQIQWEDVDVLAEGATGERRRPGTSSFAVLKRPVLVYVVEDAATAAGSDSPVDKMFQRNEKLALMTKAFRTVKMSANDAAVDFFTKGHGTGLPRLLVIDPLEKEVTVLESSALDADRLRRFMTTVAADLYTERLSHVVEAHLKLLEMRDTVFQALPALRKRERGLHAAGAGARLGAVREEIAKAEQQLSALAREEAALWRLTFARQDRR